MKKIMAAPFVFVAAFGLMAAFNHAVALTFESGQVLTTNDAGEQVVANLEDTAFGQSQLEANGYVVSGTQVIIAVGDNVVKIDKSDLVNKSEDQIVELISNEIVESGFASGGIQVDGITDQVAHEAASAAAQEAYQAAVEAAVYADNIANGVSAAIAEEASQGFTPAEACAMGESSACAHVE